MALTDLLQRRGFLFPNRPTQETGDAGDPAPASPGFAPPEGASPDDAEEQVDASMVRGAAPTRGLPPPRWLGIVESVVGLISRTASLADCDHPAVTRRWVQQAVREVCLRGEHLSRIEIREGRIVLEPVVPGHTITGRRRPWTYRVSISSPNGQRDATLPGSAIVHLRWAEDTHQPWVGVGPLQSAQSTMRLASEVERALREEAAVPSFRLASIAPWVGGESGATRWWKQVVAAVRTGAGKVFPLLQSNQLTMDRKAADAFGPMLTSKADPSPGIVAVRDAVFSSVSEAFGVPAALTRETGQEGTGLRESNQRFVSTVIAPLLGRAAEELSEKLETAVTFDLEPLRANDFQQLARAAKSLVDAGATLASATAAVGIRGIQNSPGQTEAPADRQPGDRES